MRDTFALHVQRAILNCANSGRLDTLGFTPDSPDFPESSDQVQILRVLQLWRLFFWVRRYLYPLNPIHSHYLAHFDLQHSKLIHSSS
jgi:hypothetical protein